MYLTSHHAEVTQHYLEFSECQEIKCMRKQWIPGSLLRFLNGPGDEAMTAAAFRKNDH